MFNFHLFLWSQSEFFCYTIISIVFTSNLLFAEILVTVTFCVFTCITCINFLLNFLSSYPFCGSLSSYLVLSYLVTHKTQMFMVMIITAIVVTALHIVSFSATMFMKNLAGCHTNYRKMIVVSIIYI